MNIIEVVRNVLSNYDKISEFTNEINVDFNDSEEKSYGLYSTGDTKVSEDILGNSIHKHNFVLYANEQGYTNFDRLINSSFLLDLAYYLDNYDVDKLELDNGKVLNIESANGMMYSTPIDYNQNITYQLQIYATYKKEI